MNIRQMFPKRTLDAQDLHAFAPSGCVVTVESIDYKTMQADRPGDVEIVYYMKVVEFKKPFKLSSVCAGQVADLLGDETDEWVGKTIKIVPCRVQVFKDMVWVINAEAHLKGEKPTLAPNNDITAFAVLHPSERVVKYLSGARAHDAALPSPAMGIDTALKIMSSLHERGKKWDDFVKHMKTEGAAELVSGKIPPDCPSSVVEWARSYCKMFGKVNAPLSPSQIDALRASWEPPRDTARNTKPAGMGGDVIDPTTGEVIEEDDIPF